MNGDEAGAGVLAGVIQAASIASRRSLDDLTALSRKYDPYRFGRAKGHREGQWFAGWFARLVRPVERIHLRGLHYRLVAHGGVVKPDGTRYVNSDADSLWMQEEAAKAARWLGYVPFSRFTDSPLWFPLKIRKNGGEGRLGLFDGPHLRQFERLEVEAGPRQQRFDVKRPALRVAGFRSFR
jgi:hypothetical protein